MAQIQGTPQWAMQATLIICLSCSGVVKASDRPNTGHANGCRVVALEVGARMLLVENYHVEPNWEESLTS